MNSGGSFGIRLNLHVIIHAKLFKCVWCNYIQLNTWKIGSLSWVMIRPLLYNNIGTGWLVQFGQDPQVPQAASWVPKGSYAQNMFEDGGLHRQNRWKRFIGCSWWFIPRRNSWHCIYWWICKTSVQQMRKMPLACEHNTQAVPLYHKFWISTITDFTSMCSLPFPSIFSLPGVS